MVLVMTEKKDRFQRVDRALERVREELDEAVDDSRELGDRAAREVREAIDDVEDKLKNLRRRDD